MIFMEKPQEIPKQHLAPNAQLLFFLNYIGKTAIILPMLIVGLFFQPLYVGAIFVAYILLTYLVALLVYQNFVFWVDDNGFEKEYGVFHKYHVGIPFQQVQNVNIKRSIIDRMLGIAHIEIETAGSSAVVGQATVSSASKSTAEGVLPGITTECAKQVQDILLTKALENR